VGADEVGALEHCFHQLRPPLIGREPLVFLRDARLQQQFEFAPADGLYEEVLCALYESGSVIRREIDKRVVNPSSEACAGAGGIDLGFSHLDGDLDAALPASFLDIEHAGGRGAGTFHPFRSEK
jgi:hypothetical protein